MRGAHAAKFSSTERTVRSDHVFLEHKKSRKMHILDRDNFSPAYHFDLKFTQPLKTMPSNTKIKKRLSAINPSRVIGAQKSRFFTI